MRRTLLVVLPLAASLAASGCGGKKSESESESKSACKASALESEPKLPADFPKPGEVTYTRQQQAGPSLVVEGYWESELPEAYNEYRDQVKEAGYTVLFSEREGDRDAEISYKGPTTTGQIALRGNCSEDATTRVHITSRPK